MQHVMYRSFITTNRMQNGGNHMYRRIISFILTICVCFCILPTSVFAINATTEPEYTYVVDCSISVEESLIRAYSNLSPEAKEIFDSRIASNPALVEYHQNIVDPSYDVTQYMSSLSRSAVDIITSGLSNMNLPVQVQEALNLLSSAILAALADGPLPAGELYALSILLLTAIALADHWDVVAPQWDSIVLLFQQAFTSIISPISTSMASIKEDTIQENTLPDTIIITVNPNNKMMRIGGRSVLCNTVVESDTEVNGNYYPALLFSGILFFFPNAVSSKEARAIMSANIDSSGVLAQTGSMAKNLCYSIGPVVSHGPHENMPNFLNHYHFTRNNKNSNSHAWYLIP